VSISESEKQVERPTNPLWEFIPKTCIGLIAAVAVPVLVLFIVTLLIFGLVSIFSKPNPVGESGPADTVRVTFGIALFIAGYAVLAGIPCAGCLGIPVILLGWRLRLIRWWTCVIVGFFLSSIPGGLYLVDTFSKTTSSANGVQYWIHGVPTTAGLIELIISILVMGFMGALGGFSFWLVWRLFSRYGASESVS
jgi:hypothetical protein